MSFDFSAVVAPFRMQPGLRRLAEGTKQLTPNDAGIDSTSPALTEKLAVLAHHADQALLCASGFDATPAMHALAAHAVAEHPDAFAWDGAHHFEARRLGWALIDGSPVGTGPRAVGDVLRSLPKPWRLAALLSLGLAEDFAVIDGSTGHIPWLAVCLPSHWSPQDKVGRHFSQVHAPVADNQLLLTASDHLARLVTQSHRWERFVWTITRQHRLDAHPRRHTSRGWPQDVGAEGLAKLAHFRTERQTFIPLPQHGQAIFTIHVEVHPLTEAVDGPGHARQLHDALASMSPSVLAYRNLTDARDRLLAWLAARSDIERR